MSITEADIEEVAHHRPYQGLDSRSLGALLDAFESFIPNLKSYGVSVEDALKDHAEDSIELLGSLRSIEPTVSQALFEILFELSIRSNENSGSYWDEFTLWESRGLFYGFGPEAIGKAIDLRDQHK